MPGTAAADDVLLCEPTGKDSQHHQRYDLLGAASNQKTLRRSLGSQHLSLKNARTFGFCWGHRTVFLGRSFLLERPFGCNAKVRETWRGRCQKEPKKVFECGRSWWVLAKTVIFDDLWSFLARSFWGGLNVPVTLYVPCLMDILILCGSFFVVCAASLECLIINMFLRSLYNYIEGIRQTNMWL